MTGGERAWLVLGAGVVGWNLCAREGEMLSECADRYPWVARILGLVLFLHVGNLLSPKWDIVHIGFSMAHKGVHGRS